MLHCNQCGNQILVGDEYKSLSVGPKIHGQEDSESFNRGVCCMFCESNMDVNPPKFGCDKPTAMEDWSASRASEDLYFEFISPQRESQLHIKLHKIDPWPLWWPGLTDSEQHIVAKGFDTRREER